MANTELLNISKLFEPVIQPTTSSFQTSESVLKQTQEAPSTPEDTKFQTTADWYAELKQRNLVPYEKDYYFQNSKQILKDLGVTDMSDEDIMTYLDNNDLEGLDNIILNRYKDVVLGERDTQYRDILENLQMTADEKYLAIKNIKKKEIDINTLVTPENIRDIRARLTADLIAKQEEIPGRNKESVDALYSNVYKTNVLSQAIQKNMKEREGRSYLTAFGDFTENFVPGTRITRLSLMFEDMESKGLLPQTDATRKYIKALASGTGLGDMASYVWSLPDEDFKKIVDYISKSGTTNLLFQAEILGYLAGSSSIQRSVQNAFDALSMYRGVSQLKEAKNILPKKAVTPQVTPALTGPIIIDAEYEVVGEEIAAGAKGATGTSKMLAPLAKSKNNLVVVNGSQDFTLKDYVPTKLTALNALKAVTPVTPAQAATQATAAGEPLVGDVILGGRTAATEGLVSKLVTDKPVTPSEFMTFMPDITTATEKATVGNMHAFEEATKLKTPQSSLLSLESLQERGPVLTVEDIDPEAADRLINKAVLKQELSRESLANIPLDIKIDMSIPDIQSGGLILKEVYGVGYQGEKPITENTLRRLLQQKDNLEGFRIIKDVNGETWLARESYIPYDETIASPINWGDFNWVDMIKSPLFSAGGVLPKELSGKVVQAVGYQSGWKDTLSNNILKALKKMSKQDKELANSIIHNERLTDKYMSEEERTVAANHNTKVVNLVKEIQELNKVNESILNHLIRNQAIEKGNNWIRPNKALSQAGLQGLATELYSDVRTGRVLDHKPKGFGTNFVAKIDSEGKGIIFEPGTDVPFDSSKEMLIVFDPPIAIKNDIISHLILPKTSSAVTIAPLPMRMIGERAWAGLDYKDKYLIRAQRNTFDSARRPKAYQKTVVSATNPEQAKEIIDKFSKIGKIVERLNAGLITQEAADEELAYEALRGKYPLTSTFTNVRDLQSWMDAHGVFVEDLQQLSFDRSQFTPLSTIQIGGDDSLVMAGNLATRFTRTNDIINPTIDASMPRYANVVDYVANTLNVASTRLGLVPTYNMLGTRLLTTYKPLIDPNNYPQNPIAFMRDPDRFIPIQNREHPLYRQAKIAINAVNTAMDQKASTPSLFDSIKDDIIDSLVNSTLPGADTLGDAIYKSPNMLNKLHGVMYSAFFALRPSQFIIQTFATAAQSMMLDPVNTARGLSLVFPMMNIMQSLRRGVGYKEMAEAMTQWSALKEQALGLGAEDLLRLAEEARRLGYGQLAFNDVRNNGISETVNNWSLTPFEYGNMTARMLGTLVSALRESERAGIPIKNFTNKNWETVAINSDALSGGSSRANRRPFQNIPIVKEASMFSSFTMNEIETFFGKKLNLSKKDLMKIFGASISLWGASFLLDDTTSQKTGLWLSSQAKEYLGVDIDPNTFAAGLGGWLLKQALGYDVSWGSLAPRTLDVFMLNWVTSLLSDKSADLRPPALAFLSRGLDAAKTAWAYTVTYRPEDSFKGLTPLERAEKVAQSIMSMWSGLSEAQQLWYAVKYNLWVNKQGVDRLSYDDPRKDLVKKTAVQALLGIRPIDETSIKSFAIREREAAIRGEHTEGVKLAIAKGRQVRKLIIENAPKEAIEKAEREYQTTMWLATQDLTPEQKNVITNQIARGILSTTDNREKQVISKIMNPFTKEDPGIQYYIEQEREQLNKNRKDK